MRPGAGPGIPVMATAEELGELGRPRAVPITPAVSFGEGRRPESRTQVQMAEFDGPLALLLSLIEARQLDVLTVPARGARRRLPRRARSTRRRTGWATSARSWPSPASSS